MQRLQPFFLFLMVVMMSGVFITQFGAQSQGCSQFGRGQAYAARVNGRTLTVGDFRAAYAATGHVRYPATNARTWRLRELTLAGLIERELLADEATRLGIRVTEDEVMDELNDHGTVFVNPPVDAPQGYPGPRIDTSQAFQNRDGHFSAKQVTRYINYGLRRSTAEFLEWQTREHLALKMRDTIAAQVSVSPEEVRNVYDRDTERAQLEYFQFRPSYYRDRIQPTDADVRTWMAAHTTEVDEEYTRQRHLYTGLELQVRSRHIQIDAPSTMTEAERAAARTRAEALLVRARAGEDFAALARDNSDDDTTARRGGDLGFMPRGRRDAAFDDVQFALEPGQVGETLLESPFGFHIVKVEARREGDVPEDEAKRELAETLYVAARSGEMAHEEAIRAIAYLRDGHTVAELDTQLLHNWEVPPPPAPVEPAADGTTPAPVAEAETPARDTLAPQVRETRNFSRTDAPIPGSFDSGPLTRIAFGMTMESPLPEEPIQLGTDWFVYSLKERTHATDEGFTDEVRQRITEQLLAMKRVEAVRVYVRQLRAAAASRVQEDPTILDYGDGEPASDEDSDEEPAEEETALPRRRDPVPA
jgi:peptidyl-prolyl cis-trans isomerase D